MKNQTNTKSNSLVVNKTKKIGCLEKSFLKRSYDNFSECVFPFSYLAKNPTIFNSCAATEKKTKSEDIH